MENRMIAEIGACIMLVGCFLLLVWSWYAPDGKENDEYWQPVFITRPVPIWLSAAVMWNLGLTIQVIFVPSN